MSDRFVRRGRVTGKAMAGVVLLGIAAGALAFGLAREARQSAPAPPLADHSAAESQQVHPDAVVVYYFHGNARCPT